MLNLRRSLFDEYIIFILPHDSNYSELRDYLFVHHFSQYFDSTFKNNFISLATFILPKPAGGSKLLNKLFLIDMLYYRSVKSIYGAPILVPLKVCQTPFDCAMDDRVGRMVGAGEWLRLGDKGFELEGFCVVRGPDLLWGGDVRLFHLHRIGLMGLSVARPAKISHWHEGGHQRALGLRCWANFAG